MQELCNASRGLPPGHLISITGIPGSQAGLCSIPTASPVSSRSKIATVMAFNRANVAVLIEIFPVAGSVIDQQDRVDRSGHQYVTPRGRCAGLVGVRGVAGAPSR